MSDAKTGLLGDPQRQGAGGLLAPKMSPEMLRMLIEALRAAKVGGGKAEAPSPWMPTPTSGTRG